MRHLLPASAPFLDVRGELRSPETQQTLLEVKADGEILSNMFILLKPLYIDFLLIFNHVRACHFACRKIGTVCIVPFILF